MSDAQIPRTNLLAIAKRESSRQNLYARFFRGPILGPETLDGLTDANIPKPSMSSSSPTPCLNTTSSTVAAVESETSIVISDKVERRKNKEGCKLYSEEQLSKEERRRRRREKRLDKERQASRESKGKMKEAVREAVDPDRQESGSCVDTLQKKSKKRKQEREAVDEAALVKQAKRQKKKEKEQEGKRKSKVDKTKVSREKRKREELKGS